jgi:outer membrane biosynthesis protein TonB
MYALLSLTEAPGKPTPDLELEAGKRSIAEEIVIGGFLRRGITAPRAKHAPDPSYSEAARQAMLQGTTVLLGVITLNGKTVAISVKRSVSSGLAEPMRSLGYELDLRAVEAVSQWKFDPARFADKSVPVVINVEVNFRLR